MSIQSQINAAAAGATVTIAPGTYTENVTIPSNKAGLKLIGGPGVLIRPPAAGFWGIQVLAHNVLVKGFEIANARGMGVWGDGVHHIAIVDCEVYGCGESGLAFTYCDWVTVEGCETWECAKNGWFSGISLYQNRDLVAGTPVGGFRNVIRNNVCHDNVTKGGAHTDGNGIIIDDFHNGQNGSTAGNYPHATLVENNLCYGNGGKGVQVTWSDKVTLKKNTAYGNNIDAANPGTWRGELSVSDSLLAEMIANVAVANPGSGILSWNRAYCDTSSSPKNTTTWTNNIGWDARTPGKPSIHLNERNDSPGSGIQWIDPKLDNKGVPTITTTAGYRPTGTLPPIEEPDPDMEALIARIVALETAVAGLRAADASLLVSIAEAKVTVEALAARVTGIEGLPIDPALGGRVTAAEAELSRLDGRLDAIANGAQG